MAIKTTKQYAIEEAPPLAPPPEIASRPNKRTGELARQLSGSKLSAFPTALEGIAHAASKGYGAYLQTEQGRKENAYQKSLSDSLTHGIADPQQRAIVGAIASKNPAAAARFIAEQNRYQADIERRREEKAADRKYAESQYDKRYNQKRKDQIADRDWSLEQQRKQKIAAAEAAAAKRAQTVADKALEHQRKKELAEHKHAIKNSGKTDLGAYSGWKDGRNWDKFVDPATQERKQIYIPTGETSDQVMQNIAKMQPGTIVKPSAIPAPGGGSAASEAAPQPIESAPPTVQNARPDGTGMLNGHKVKWKDVAPEVFEAAVELEPAFSKQATLKQRIKDTSQMQKDFRAQGAAGRKLESQLDTFDAANKHFATGAFGETKLFIAKMLNSAGLLPDNMVGASVSHGELLSSANLFLSKYARDGFPGQVSNYEQMLYKAAVPGLENTRLGNWMIGQRLRASVRLVKMRNKFAVDYLKEKGKAGVAGVLDSGFESYFQRRMKDVDLYTDKERAVHEYIKAATESGEAGWQDKALGMLDAKPAAEGAAAPVKDVASAEPPAFLKGNPPSAFGKPDSVIIKGKDGNWGWDGSNWVRK
jgi:hypothetical protein